jgi:hypothetical protein
MIKEGLDDGVGGILELVSNGKKNKKIGVVNKKSVGYT